MLESKKNQTHASNFLNWLLEDESEFSIAHESLPEAIDDYNLEYSKATKRKGGDWGGISFYISANHIPNFIVERRKKYYRIKRSPLHNPNWIIDT